MSTQLYDGEIVLPELPFTQIDGIYIYGYGGLLYLDIVSAKDIVSISLGATFIEDKYWEVQGNDPQIFGNIISYAFKEAVYLQITETQIEIVHKDGKKTIFPIVPTENYIAFDDTDFDSVAISNIGVFGEYFSTMRSLNEITSVPNNLKVEGWILSVYGDTIAVANNNIALYCDVVSSPIYYNQDDKRSLTTSINLAKFILSNGFETIQFIYSEDYSAYTVSENITYYVDNTPPIHIKEILSQVKASVKINYKSLQDGLSSLMILQKTQQIVTDGNIVIGYSPANEVGVYLADAAYPTIGLSCGPGITKSDKSFSNIVNSKYLLGLANWYSSNNENDDFGILYLPNSIFIGFTLPNNSFLFVVTESPA